MTDLHCYKIFDWLIEVAFYNVGYFFASFVWNYWFFHLSLSKKQLAAILKICSGDYREIIHGRLTNQRPEFLNDHLCNYFIFWGCQVKFSDTHFQCDRFLNLVLKTLFYTQKHWFSQTFCSEGSTEFFDNIKRTHI